jgi:predicted peroxiredoxin
VLTAAGVDVLFFFTIDGGTTWRGVLAQADSK